MSSVLFQNLKELFGKKKGIFTALGVFVVITVLFIVYMILTNRSVTQKPTDNNNQTIQPTLTPYLRQEKFIITKTFPDNAELEISTGEIVISFTTDVPIVSANSFSYTITPAVPHYTKVTGKFPAKTVYIQVYGNLTRNTKYTVTVNNSDNQEVKKWEFTTANKAAQSSSGLVREKEEKLIQEYYPLLQRVPYNTRDFSIDYRNRLLLAVKVKNKDLNLVKKGVSEWIRSAGVDPTTHTYIYENSF